MKMLEICLRYAARLHVGSMNLRALSEIRCKGTAFSQHTQYFVPQLSPFVPPYMQHRPERSSINLSSPIYNLSRRRPLRVKS